MASSSTRGFHARGRGRGRPQQQYGNNQWQRQDTGPVRWPSESESTILVVDLEATCWESPAEKPQGEANEIIEIGWALVDLKQNPPVTIRDGTVLVKPTRSNVSKFCTQLTTITAELLEAEGVSLKEAFQTLVTELQSNKLVWCSWGDYDRNMINKQCKAFSLDSPFSSTHYNVKDIFKSLYPNHPEGYGMNNAYQTAIGKPIEGTHHRGGDDAKNIATILNFLMTKKPGSIEGSREGQSSGAGNAACYAKRNFA